MKRCKSCGKSKPFDQFTLRGKRRPGEYQNDCDDCRRKVLRDKKRHIASLVKRWKMMKGCARCDFKAENSVQLEIDHIIPLGRNRKHRQAVNNSWSKERLKRELSKCQVLCANCHRLKSYLEGSMFKKKEE